MGQIKEGAGTLAWITGRGDAIPPEWLEGESFLGADGKIWKTTLPVPNYGAGYWVCEETGEETGICPACGGYMCDMMIQSAQAEKT